MIFFPQKTSKRGSKEAYKRGLGGNKQAVRQAGWAQGSEVNSLAAACSVLTTGAFFMLTFFKRHRLCCVFLDPAVYVPARPPPTRKRAAARPFPRHSQGLKASRTFPVLRFSTDKVLLSACARVWKRLVVMRGDKERCSLSSGRHCKEFLGTLHIWCELCPRWPLLPSERTTGKPQWKSSTCASV